MYRILSWDTTADSHVMAQFYLAIACSSQATIWLWNMGWFYPNVATLKQLESFHNQCAHSCYSTSPNSLTCIQHTWEYPPSYWWSIGFLWIVGYLNIYWMVQDKTAQSICQTWEPIV
jgi:hypothetical protein